jgi:hypothetical protein
MRQNQRNGIYYRTLLFSWNDGLNQLQNRNQIGSHRCLLRLIGYFSLPPLPSIRLSIYAHGLTWNGWRMLLLLLLLLLYLYCCRPLPRPVATMIIYPISMRTASGTGKKVWFGNSWKWAGARGQSTKCIVVCGHAAWTKAEVLPRVVRYVGKVHSFTSCKEQTHSSYATKEKVQHKNWLQCKTGNCPP